MTLPAKFDLYRKQIKGIQDKDGFIESDACDALLFSGLIGCVKGVDVNIDAAKRMPISGEWLRRPPACGTCVEEGFDRSLWRRIMDGLGAECVQKEPTFSDAVARFVGEFQRGNSTISRDMLIGLAWYAWYNKRLDISEAVIKRALGNWGVVGRGDPSKINIMPGLLATFAWISYKLGGPSRAWLRWIPADTGSKVVGFQAHLQVLHVLLRCHVTGAVPSKYATIFKYQADREPNNALFQYAAYRWGKVIDLLSTEKWWPENRLPTENDRSEQWLFQRDEGSDWESANDARPRVHSGGDFLFVYALVCGQMK